METTHVIFPPKLRFKTLRFFMSSKCAAVLHTLAVVLCFGCLKIGEIAAQAMEYTTQTVKNCQSRKRMVPSFCIYRMLCSGIIIIISDSSRPELLDWLFGVPKKQSTCFSPKEVVKSLQKVFQRSIHFKSIFSNLWTRILDIQICQIVTTTTARHLHNSDILLCLCKHKETLILWTQILGHGAVALFS